MINSYIYLTIFLLIVGKGCDSAVVEREMDMSEPVAVPSDKHLADVFKPLDGTWKGTFLIYEDQNGQQVGQIEPSQVSEAHLNSLTLKQTGIVSVKQVYSSSSPYFQEVQIEDTYLENGKEKTVASHGVNKIQGGEMWCVVQKPDEKVVHRGSTDGEHTIIWGRSVREPLKVEYFRETVLSDTYEIIGYGYYGSDDPKLTPRIWFHGNYARL